MSRQLDNLKRIFRKLQARYGDDDALVSEVKHDVELREGLESGYQQWLDANTQGISSHFAQRRSRRYSGGTLGQENPR